MKRRFDLRKILKFAAPAFALALILCVAGSMAAPTFAAGTEPVSVGDYSLVTEILAVFTMIGTWLTTAVTSLMPMFYVAGSGLTFLGVLAVVGLAFSVVFLLIGLIQKFLHFRG